MKLIQSSVSLENFDTPYEFIEYAARTCYKSENNMFSDSIVFVRTLINNKHYAMLEHGKIVFEVYLNDRRYKSELSKYYEYLKTFKYLNVTFNETAIRLLVSSDASNICKRGVNDAIFEELKIKYPELIFNDASDSTRLYKHVSANVINIDDVYSPSREELQNHKYYTFKFIVDRGVSHELVRHRSFSFAQESTRYCNYSYDKFDNQLTFIRPSTFNDWSDGQRSVFLQICQAVEGVYLYMTDPEYPSVLAPQQARSILTNCVKTEIVVTGNLKCWEDFLDLRYFESTGKAHPDMKKVASEVHDLIY